MIIYSKYEYLGPYCTTIWTREFKSFEGTKEECEKMLNIYKEIDKKSKSKHVYRLE